MNTIRKTLAATAVALVAMLVVGSAAPADAARTSFSARPVGCC